MNNFVVRMLKTSILLQLLITIPLYAQWYIPANYRGISDPYKIHLTKIGAFGLLRKARPTVPAHYHTGIDIVRPDSQFQKQPIFPAKEGEVVSVLDNGPYSQIIIKHSDMNRNFWTVYEHLHVSVKKIKHVTQFDTIGYFFSKDELNRYGWQFNHFHFEILKLEPPKFKSGEINSLRYYKTFGILCFSRDELIMRQENPLEFLSGKIVKRN
ncbi:MAG TPA: M23 family metallopeptidase [Chitinispirillaceae bacterium]|nr:M23 family metallopeptidase [Chitinispirillaceae bacterium]